MQFFPRTRSQTLRSSRWTWLIGATLVTLNACDSDLQSPVPTSVAVYAGDAQSAVVGTAVATAPAVRVTDASGKAVAHVPVTFSVTAGGGSAAGSAATTDANGIATLGSWTLGTMAGNENNSLRASASGVGSVTFTASALAGAPASITIDAGEGQSVRVGLQVPVNPTVAVADEYDNPVPDVPIVFAVRSGAGSVSSASPNTGAAGIAAVGSWTLGALPGTNVLVATTSALPDDSVVFTATATPPVWEELAADGDGPGNYVLTTGYSETEDVIYVCENRGDNVAGALWKFDLNTHQWTAIATTGWPIGKYRKCILDPIAEQILTYWDGIGRVFAVSTSGGAWTELGSNGEGQAYYEGAPFFDPVSGQLTHFAGYGLGTFKNTLQTFAKATNTWVGVGQTGPPDGRFGPPRDIDIQNERAFFAGRSRGAEGVDDDLWVLDLNTHEWTNLIPTGAANALDRYNTGLACIPAENALYRFGGDELVVGGYSNELVRIDLDAVQLAYEVIETTATVPSARRAPNLHYDSARHRLILIGGMDDTQWRADVWAIELPVRD